jgi:proteic killer suppression protein
MTKVTWGKQVEKQLDRIPDVIHRKFRLWVALVEESGVREVRKNKGFHDEPLKGTRQGQRPFG